MDGADGPGGAQAVDGRADDPAGEARTFTAGVKTQNAGALPSGRVTYDADRGTAPRFRTGKGRGLEKKALKLTVHDWQTAIQGTADRWWEQIRQVGGDSAPAIT